MRSNAIWLIIVLFLLTVIGVLSWIILGQPPTIITPNPAAQTPGTTHPTDSAGSPQGTTSSTPTLPLHERVSIDQPASGASVGDTFTVSGRAPSDWYFEATFPIQVRDVNDNVIGRGHANAEGDWMTTNLVAFTTTITIDRGYKGSATLILLRDNPSGLPENDDSVSIPIVIK